MWKSEAQFQLILIIPDLNLPWCLTFSDDPMSSGKASHAFTAAYHIPGELLKVSSNSEEY